MRCLLLSMLTALVFLITAGPSPAQQNKKDKDVEEKRSKIKINGKAMVDWLDDLKSADPSVRERGIATIKAYGHAAAEIGAKHLIKALDDPDSSVRVNAVISLGFVGMEEIDREKGVNALLRVLSQEREGIVRYQAVRSLGRLGVENLGGSDTHAVVPLLIRSLNDRTNHEIRAAAAYALSTVSWKGEGPDPRAIHALIECVMSPSERSSDVRAQAIISLIMLTYYKHLVPMKLQTSELAAFNRVVRPNGNQPDKVVIWAHVGLASLNAKEGGSEADLLGIIHFLKSKNPESRENSARALATLAYFADAPSQGPALKVSIVNRLKDLIDALDDEHTPVFVWICVALGKLGDKAKPALDSLQKRANDPNPDIKAAVKEAIAGITSPPKKNEEPFLKERKPKGDAPMKKR